MNPAAAAAGRVVARFGQRYTVALAGPGAATEEVDAVARGRRQQIVVGDLVDCTRARGLCVIESVRERRNLLFRCDASRTKPLAANVDQIAIVFAAQPTPQREFLWRALLAARSTGVAALAVQNKIDLDSAPAAPLLDEAARWGAGCLRVSAQQDPAGTRAQLGAACAGRATLFVGQSGMGKSTLLGLLVGASVRTGALTRRGTHGRQTTTATRWFAFGSDGAVIDSPGFQEFGLAHLPARELIRGMPEFAAVTAPCRFADCRHAEEPGCAVREAVAGGAISAERYAFYRRLCAEEQAQKRQARGF